MNKKKSVSKFNNFTGLTLKTKQQDWVQKLETKSGKNIKNVPKRAVAYLLMDCSKSMSYKDKMDQAKKGSLAFSEEAIKKGYHVGLITFDTFARHVLEPQNDIVILQKKIADFVSNGSTNMTGALQIAIETLMEIMGEKVLCIVTDGSPDNMESSLKFANIAHSKGIGIMTIGTDDADICFLQQISTRKELSVKVKHHQLERGIVSMAKMLPEKINKYD